MDLAEHETGNYCQSEARCSAFREADARAVSAIVSTGGAVGLGMWDL